MERLRFLLSVLFAGFCLLDVLQPVHGAITWTGNLDPADPTTWTDSTNGYVGKTANGSLVVNGGDDLSSHNGYIGYNSGVTGQVTIDGVGSAWSNGSSLSVGYCGRAILAITDGGAVSNESAAIGCAKDSTGEVTVSGPGSTWTNIFSIRVAYGGSGTLTIHSGGTVTSEHGLAFDYSAAGVIAEQDGSTGRVTVRGSGSKWLAGDALFDNLYVGREGTGTLAITDGGLVRVGGTLTIDYDNDDDSFVDMARGGMLALAGDADGSLGEFLDLVYGTDAIRYWDDSLADWAPITAATPGVDYTLAYVDEGGSDLYGYTVLTVGTIPEPGAILAMFAGALVLLARRARWAARS